MCFACKSENNFKEREVVYLSQKLARLLYHKPTAASTGQTKSLANFQGYNLFLEALTARYCLYCSGVHKRKWNISLDPSQSCCIGGRKFYLPLLYWSMHVILESGHFLISFDIWPIFGTGRSLPMPKIGCWPISRGTST